ncbi:MAG: hypothetical protein VR68_11915 [Peptococcaceae bacterium BRH_c4a]|nr:MAG: hypothetical protein VR68_11915 [Peptococcaceae bacterium BRH_c4a]
MSDSTHNDYLDVRDLKNYLNIGITKAYQLAQRKDFPKVRLGNKYIFPRKAVDEWMEKEASRGCAPRKLRAM